MKEHEVLWIKDHECTCQKRKNQICNDIDNIFICKKCDGKVAFELDMGMDETQCLRLGYFRCINCGARKFVMVVDE